MLSISRSGLISVFNTFLLWGCRDPARIGFSEIELWGIAPHLDIFHAAEARVNAVRKTLASQGLSTWCFTPEQVVHPINIASGDDARRRDSVDRFCPAVDICATLGARRLFLTSGRGHEDEGPAHAWARAADPRAEIADHAALQDVRCLPEPLQRVETNAQAWTRSVDASAPFLDRKAVPA